MFPTISKTSLIICHIQTVVNFPFGQLKPSSDEKNLDTTKLKAFADHKLNIIKMVISLFDRVEIIWEKRKMLVTSIFSFSTLFSKAFFFRVVKSLDCVVKSLRIYISFLHTCSASILFYLFKSYQFGDKHSNICFHSNPFLSKHVTPCFFTVVHLCVN